MKGITPLKQTIKRGKKRKARKMREYAHHVKDEDPGTTSTHLMVSDIIDDDTGLPREEGPYHVWPSITTDKEGYDPQTDQEAYEKGEMFKFKNLKKAQKFEHGSWKKGKYKK